MAPFEPWTDHRHGQLEPSLIPSKPMQRLGSLLLAILASILLWMLRRTWRVRVCGQPPFGPCLFTFWHGDQVALCGARMDRTVTVLVSRSRDGGWAAQSARWLGYRTVRGSTSAGAVPGALGLVRRLLCGEPAAVAADGPRGPFHKTGDSAARLAARGKAPLVPVAAAARRGMTLSSWDRLLLPAPFTTVFVVFGRPIVDDGVQCGLDETWQRACEMARSDSCG